jgi:D-glycero-D-manno-heptose 1,7-bisphosphate phosphatase
MEKFVLLDRDGVINVIREDGINSYDDFVFVPMIPEAFYEFERKRVNAVILDNDQSLANGTIDYGVVGQINSRIEEHVSDSGGRVHDILVCPSNDDVKYPNPALLEKAAEKHGFSLADTYFITASLEGLQAGWAAGCKTAFVKTGKPYKTMQYLKSSDKCPEIVQPDLLTIAVRICSEYNQPSS